MAETRGGINRDPVHISVILVEETKMALYVETNSLSKAWIPKSLITGLPKRYQMGDRISIQVPAWLAKRKKL